MKIEFTRAEIERIILDHANRLMVYADPFVNQTVKFVDVAPGDYRSMPESIVVSTKEDDAAQ
jgi:hypothetical protein